MFGPHTSTFSSTLFAGVLVIGASGQAATYNWLGTSGTTTAWSDSTKWQDQSAVNGVPIAADTAQLHVSVTANTLLNVGSGASVGSISARASNGVFVIRANEAGGRTFAFNNSGSDSIVTVSRSSGTVTDFGRLYFGTDANALSVQLANNLLLRNDGARTQSGSVNFGVNSTLTGGSSGDRRTITVASLGTSSMTANLQGAATFVGDWVVDGAKATLKLTTNSFGDASNTVTLKNSGILDLDSFVSGYTLTRSLSGNGLVKAANGLTLGSAGELSPGLSKGTLNVTTSTLALGTGSLDIELVANNDSDLIAVTGAVTLGGSLNLSTLGGYTPVNGDSWTIITATGDITGSFSAPLPAGYSATIVSGATDSLVVSYVPEPGTALAASLLGLLATRRRARRA